MSNISQTLYTSVTTNLDRRVHQRRFASPTAFTGRYNCTWRVYYELFKSIVEAVVAEMKIKGWKRDKKLALVLAANPRWQDLSAHRSDTKEPDSSAATLHQNVMGRIRKDIGRAPNDMESRLE